MFYQTAVSAAHAASPLTLTQTFEGDTMFNPKWAVIAVALAVFAMAASYDAQLGLAVGIVMRMRAIGVGPRGMPMHGFPSVHMIAHGWSTGRGIG